MKTITKKLANLTVLLLIIAFAFTACTQVTVTPPSDDGDSSSAAESQTSTPEEPDPTESPQATTEPEPTAEPEPTPDPQSQDTNTLSEDDYIRALIGVWENSTAETTYSFGDNGTFALATPESTSYGQYFYQNGLIDLYSNGVYISSVSLDFGGSTPTLFVNGSDGTYVWIDTFDSLDYDEVSLLGDWYYVYGEIIYSFYDDNSYHLDDATSTSTGGYYYDNTNGAFELYDDETNSYVTGRIETYGDVVLLYLNSLDGYFYPN